MRSPSVVDTRSDDWFPISDAFSPVRPSVVHSSLPDAEPNANSCPRLRCDSPYSVDPITAAELMKSDAWSNVHAGSAVHFAPLRWMRRAVTGFSSPELMTRSPATTGVIELWLKLVVNGTLHSSAPVPGFSPTR